MFRNLPMMRKFLLFFFFGLVLFAAAGYVVLAALSRPVPPHPFFTSDKTLVMAHQSGTALGPGNTIPTFARALALGADVLEMNLRQTRDGVPVVLHDATVDRTTGGSGRVSAMSLAELKLLDAGYRWSADGAATYPFRGKEITVPTLEEVFDAFPDQCMVIEIKSQGPALAAALCQQVRTREKTDQVLVASFRTATIEAFRAACPEVATSVSFSEGLTFFVLSQLHLEADFQPPAQALQVPEYFGKLHVVDQRFVHSAQAHNIQVHVWTVNEPEAMQRLLDLGVDGLITDYPGRLLTLLLC